MSANWCFYERGVESCWMAHLHEMGGVWKRWVGPLGWDGRFKEYEWDLWMRWEGWRWWNGSFLMSRMDVRQHWLKFSQWAYYYITSYHMATFNIVLPSFIQFYLLFYICWVNPSWKLLCFIIWTVSVKQLTMKYRRSSLQFANSNKYFKQFFSVKE